MSSRPGLSTVNGARNIESPVFLPSVSVFIVLSSLFIVPDRMRVENPGGVHIQKESTGVLIVARIRWRDVLPVGSVVGGHKKSIPRGNPPGASCEQLYLADVPGDHWNSGDLLWWEFWNCGGICLRQNGRAQHRQAGKESGENRAESHQELLSLVTLHRAPGSRKLQLC